MSLICLLLTISLLSGCGPNIVVSTDPLDVDLSSFHPDVVRGEGFTIQPDVRVFALFAYLNGPAGWSEENGEAFSPQRAQLRADLQARLAQLDPQLVERWRNFYEQHKQISYRYLYYTLTLGAPPEFNYIIPVEEMKYPEIIGSLDGFNRILAEFYRQADIQALFEETYRDVMMAEVRKYDRARILGQIGYIYDYLRLDRSKLGTFDVSHCAGPL